MSSQIVFGGELRNNCFEVHFKGHHVPHLPWTYLESEKVPDIFPCHQLSHVTHNFPASEIASNDEECYIFKPRPKTGRERESYRSTYSIVHQEDSLDPRRYTKYWYLDERETVFPGCYTWWSPSHEDLEYSVHGNKKFTVNLTQLLQCYQKSIKGDSDTLPDIHFRCGGTLRYNKQACKVIIVCPVRCPDLDLINETVPPLNMGIGLGDLTQREIVPKLSYEVMSHRVTYAFALYYPHEYYNLKCPKNIVTISDIRHQRTPFCSGKEYDWYEQRHLCPNVISNSKETSWEIKQPTKRKRNEEEGSTEASSSKRFAAAAPAVNNEEVEAKVEIDQAVGAMSIAMNLLRRIKGHFTTQ